MKPVLMIKRRARAALWESKGTPPTPTHVATRHVVAAVRDGDGPPRPADAGKNERHETQGACARGTARP